MSRRRVFLAAGAVLLVFAGSGLFWWLHRVNHRDDLWHHVHDECVLDQAQHGDPAPCAYVALGQGAARGFAIYKDRQGATQFLLIPTGRISGIDDPVLLLPSAPNYWASAWQARAYVEKAAKRAIAWDAIGLAINSAIARSQDQLHIHIDCVQPDVHDALVKHMREIGTGWAPFPVELHGLPYLARRLAATDLAAQDPFKLLAAGVPGAAQDMRDETLALVGADFGGGEKGFVLLAGRADLAKMRLAHGANLLDHTCRLLSAK
jgi:CDP-diacylglycerol pyrophosphatase